RPAVLGPGVVTAKLLFTGAAAADLKGLARESGCTVAMTLLAGINALLYRYSGREDLLVSSVFSGRDRPELGRLVGLFMNTVTLRTDLSGAPSFRALMLRVRGVVLEAYRHQDLPIATLLEKLFTVLPVSRTLLSRVLFNMLSFAAEAVEPVRGFAVTAFATSEEQTKFDLAFTCREGPDFVHCTLSGAADLFDAETLFQVRLDYERLLAHAVAGPDMPLDRLLALFVTR
nr:condensation domain-containing protein [Acidobacteriota bacterium]